MNAQNQINSPKKSHIINYTSLQGKTRVESLIERIQSANKEINSLLENSEESKKVVNTDNKSPKEEKPLKTLDEKITDINNKSIQVGLDENINEDKNANNENNENKEENTNKKEENKNNEKVLDFDVPFVKKTKLLLNEIKKLSENENIKEENINNEISELPKRAMIEMSLSDFKIKKEYDTIKKQLEEKNTYIKKLENEIVDQRIITNKLKKAEGEYLLKISALEDELRVMKLKLLGYNTSEQYNHHSHDKFKTDAGNCGYVYGENMIHSMWVRDNMDNKKLNNYEIENNGKPLLNKGERWEAPWVSQSVVNMNRVLRNGLLNRDHFNEIGQFKTENRFNYEMGEKNNYDNERYNNFRGNNNMSGFNGGNSNFQRVSGMILNSPNNKMKLTKNFSNEYNRFRIGNNDNNHF